MQAADVLDFLSDNPEFLDRHASRFGLCPAHDRVIPLVERQLLESKDRFRQLERNLHVLLGRAEDNDLIQQRQHRLALALVEANDFASLLNRLPTLFDALFGLRRVALRWWGEDGSAASVSVELRRHADRLPGPCCGHYVNDELLGWLPVEPAMQSFAQVPLRQGRGATLGLLLLASDDPDRFSSDRQTRYLAEMGELITAALLRCCAAGC
ncbi:DUF484 family protein [Crenobacter sp. SG2305]|uniref:DUF484 family protein n=1 Tax=Crenobacter oryzisoli TaxID=3056844 RepID=UPI0025AA8E99|nr:DUF484 family protein [Crenobacter sp. SG2305]MDN0082018.1 DUF484 family protein [Crenobacter sp. SG2305]